MMSTVAEQPSRFSGLRRFKFVRSWQISDGSVRPPTDPAFLPETVDAAVDPTQFTYRSRRRGHAWFYRWAIGLTATSVLATAGGVIVAAMGDRVFGHVLAAVGLLLGLIAIPVSKQTQLSHRILGYALTAAICAALAAGTISFLPEAWFEQPRPDEPSRNPMVPHSTARAAEILLLCHQPLDS